MTLVLGQDIRRDAAQTVVSGDSDQFAQECRAEAPALGAVTDDQGELGFVRAVQLAQSADAQDPCAPVAGSLWSATRTISRS